jgi:hypothetical protein
MDQDAAMENTEFIVAGSPREVSRAIEQYADERRIVSALVVPWESDRDTLSMAVTSAKGEGWAIEHLNLGTIRLTDLGHDRTRVRMAADESTGLDAPQLVGLFDQFARQIQRRLEAAR